MSEHHGIDDSTDLQALRGVFGALTALLAVAFVIHAAPALPAAAVEAGTLAGFIAFCWSLVEIVTADGTQKMITAATGGADA